MKKVLNFLSVVSLLTVFALLYGCKKDPEMATLTTTTVSSITTTTASSGGNITNDGGAEVTARGVCWGTATKPTVSGSKTSDGKGTGSFTSALTGLTSGTMYYVRAYATNSAGTAYGNEVTFSTTAITGAMLTTTAVTSITSTSAASGGNITADGGSPVTARGVCWATTVDPDLTKSKTTNDAGTGSFTSNITGLTPGTVYHVRAYATNNSGTTYGSDVQFTTLAVIPTVTTVTITVFTQTTATAGGNVTANGGAAVTARGVCYGTATGPTTAGEHTTAGTGDGVFTSDLTGLTPGTLYYVRAYAVNSAGTAYGSEETFTTTAVLNPTVTTDAASSITNNSAVSGGNVTADGGGTITERGICWGTTTTPTIAGSHTPVAGTTGSFTGNMTGLSDATLYYVRAYATNSTGTAYGNAQPVNTLLSDADGNLYNTVLIGNQVWMAQNLKTTQYNGGTPIPNVTSAGAWIALTTPAYCWYENEEATYKPLYGALYNWYAVNTGNLCPTGWRVPTDDDWTVLTTFLGGVSVAGGKLKEAGLTHWLAPNTGATNETGFTALPGGYRYRLDGAFNDAGKLSYWWSSTEYIYDAGKAYFRELFNDQASVFGEGAFKTAGKYVRCLKN